MDTTEPSSVESRRESIAPLTFDITERLNLYHGLHDLSTELEENPFTKPYERRVELKGIHLRSQGANKPSANLSIETAEMHNKLLHAKITLETRKLGWRDQRTYLHRPSFDMWEEWLPGATESTQILSNSSFIETIEPNLPAGVLESMMDRASKGVEVAELLASYLKKKARSRTERTRYRSYGVEVGSPEYVRDTDFIINKVNNRTIRSLFVAASLDVFDYGDIRKVYEFTTVENSGALRSANGMLRLYSSGAMPQEPLDAFVKQDQTNSDASYSIDLGIDDIRKKYSGPAS